MSSLNSRVQVARHVPPVAVSRRPGVDQIAASGWTELTPPPTPFETGFPNYAAALSDGTILVGAGDAAPSHFWIYDPMSDTYAATGSGPAGGSYNGLGSGAVIGTKAYAVGNVGSPGTAEFSAGGTWTTRAASGGSPFGSAITDGTYYYVLDGGTFNRFNPGSNSWSSLTYPPIGSAYDSLSCDGTYIWLFAANTAGTAKYTIGSNTWDSGTVLALAPTPRNYAAFGTINGNVYIAGGIDVSTIASNQLDIYNIAGDSWTTGTAMASTLATASGAVQGGKLYVFGLDDPANNPVARVYTP